jgi:hypothetical protein
MQLKYLILVSILVAFALAQFDDPSNVRMPKLRGLDKIGAGFDIVKMQQLWAPVELTYMGKSLTSPYDDIDYEIPMEIASISTPDTFINKTTNVSNNILCWLSSNEVIRNIFNAIITLIILFIIA